MNKWKFHEEDPYKIYRIYKCSCGSSLTVDFLGIRNKQQINYTDQEILEKQYNKLNKHENTNRHKIYLNKINK